MMQEPVNTTESPASPSPSSEGTTESTSVIHIVPITPLMRNRGYKQVDKSSDEENTTQEKSNSSQENSKEKGITVEVERSNSNNENKTAILSSGSNGESIGEVLIKKENGESRHIGQVLIQKDYGEDIGHQVLVKKEHDCLACEMDEIVSTAVGQSGGATSVKSAQQHAAIDIANALDAALSGQNSHYVPPVKEGNEDGAIVSEDGRKLLFLCFYCQKTFSRKDSRKRHERIHTQDKPHKCSICEKAFITTSHLKTHFLTHTGVRDFVCSFCEKAFLTSDKRNRHEKTHLKDVKIPDIPQDLQKDENGIHSIPRPVVVPKAGNHGSTPTKRVEIIPNVEKPDQIVAENGIVKYQCRFCPKSFPRIDSRKRHERTHTGQKPHVCKFCGHSFVTAYHKRLHERTHTKEKPFECSSCQKGFSRMDSLKRHEKLHE